MAGIDFINHYYQSDQNNICLIFEQLYINVKKTFKMINTFNIFDLPVFFSKLLTKQANQTLLKTNDNFSSYDLKKQIFAHCSC